MWDGTAEINKIKSNPALEISKKPILKLLLLFLFFFNTHAMVKRVTLSPADSSSEVVVESVELDIVVYALDSCFGF